MNKKPLNKDIYKTITAHILQALEKGVRPWEQCYKTAMPLRFNGLPYQGINWLLLSIEAEEKGYETAHWGTFKQIKEAGGSVRKGEKSTVICFFKPLEKEDEAYPGNVITIPVARTYRVFNLDQVDGIDKKDLESNVQALPEGEAFFDSLPASLLSTTGTPAYMPSKDAIRIPSIKRFASAEQYYATLGHEYIHWTGHTSRLNRFPQEVTKESYAFEELIAELGAAYLLPQMGIVPLVDEEHAPYINGFIQVLKNDERALFKAAAKAHKAIDYLLNLRAAVPQQLAA